MKPAWKPKTGTDTSGILDKCGCGAWGAIRKGVRWFAVCSDECGMITKAYERAIDAVIEWNLMQRKWGAK
jgi:hypothetical protein